MSEGWDGWPAPDGSDFDAAPDFDESDGPVEPDDWSQYPVEGFGRAGNSGLSEFDQADEDPAGGAGAADRPIGYGDDSADEPFEADLVDPEPSRGPDDDTPQVGFGRAAIPVGANPDVDPYADDTSWSDPQFPPRLELAQPPEPIDGYPWADPATLGADPQPLAWDDTPPPRPDPAGLAAYAGLELPAGADPWPLLAASDDPATSTLARFWAPRSDAGPPDVT